MCCTEEPKHAAALTPASDERPRSARFAEEPRHATGLSPGGEGEASQESGFTGRGPDSGAGVCPCVCQEERVREGGDSAVCTCMPHWV